MKHALVLCVAGWLLAVAAGAEPPESKPAPLTKEEQEKLKERDRLLQEANRLAREKQVDEANALAEKALILTREVRGEQHPEALNLCRALAEAYEQQANFPAAKQHRQQMLATLTGLHGKDFWQVTDAGLALEEVERLARMAPADRRRLAEAVQLNERALQWFQQGKTAEGIPLAQKALEIRQQVLGPRHPLYADSLNNLAGLYQAQGEYAKAEPLYRHALDLTGQVLGERHPNYAASLLNLAGLYQARGKYAQAEPLYRQARDLIQQVLGQRHPYYAASLNGLAALYQDQGKARQVTVIGKGRRSVAVSGSTFADGPSGRWRRAARAWRYRGSAWAYSPCSRISDRVSASLCS
jgi:tetratricopeptide (TPR) repeat protein